MKTAVDVLVSAGTIDRSFAKLGPTKDKPAMPTRQSTLLETGMSKPLASSWNPIVSKLIPIAK